jgi:probable F420-dependent oxidoreductase
MSHPRPFRFGVEMMEPFPGLSWADSAREVEALGYSTLFVPDHFHEGYGPITAMATAMMATTTLKVAPLVFACDFRHPAVLARELASIDVLSGGRLEIGVGAGYNPLDYSRSGIAMDPPGVRVDRLIEHVAVLRGLFADGSFQFNGNHYTITDLDGTPKPLRPQGPPLIIAGGGRRLLASAAQAADIIGVNPSIPAGNPSGAARDALPDRIDDKFALIRHAAGDRFDRLEFNAWISVGHVLPDESDIAPLLERRFAAPTETVLQSPVVLAGSVSQIVDRLHRRRDRWGYSYTTVQGPVAHDFAAVIAALDRR